MATVTPIAPLNNRGEHKSISEHVNPPGGLSTTAKGSTRVSRVRVSEHFHFVYVRDRNE